MEPEQTVTATPQCSQQQQPPSNCCEHQSDSFPTDIHASLCCRRFLIIYRLISMIVLMLRFYLNSREVYTSLFRVFQELTHFGFIITLLYYVLVNWDFILNEFNGRNMVPNLKQIAVVLYEVAICLQIPIVVLYWWVVNQRGKDNAWIITQDVGNHGFPFLCLFLQFFFNMVPFKTKHIGFVLLAAVVYLLINLVYSLEVQVIYKALTWKDVRGYVLVIGSLAAVASVHFVCQFLWYKCKATSLSAKSKEVSVSDNIQSDSNTV